MLSYKSIPFEVKEIIDVAGGGWEIAGYASTFGGEPDSYGDVIVAGAFRDSIAARPTKFLYEHFEPIGKQLEIREDDKGLFGRWTIVDTQTGTDAYKLAKAGVLDSLSIGYMTLEADYREDGVRLLRKVDLFEVSAVAIPANRNAVITDVKWQRFRKALAGQSPAFDIGDRVQVAGPPHMDGQGDGTVAVIEDTYTYGIVFDGMESMGIHRWYVEDELLPAAGAASSSGSGGEPMTMARRPPHAKSFEAHTADVQVALRDFLDRCKAGSAQRQAEGRSLSDARTSAIKTMSGSLRSVADELDALLVPPERLTVPVQPPQSRWPSLARAGILERPT